MHTFVRTLARRASIGLGAMALVLTAAACGGEDTSDPAAEQDPGVEEAAPEGEGPEASDGDQSDAGGDDADGEDSVDDGASDGGVSDGGGEAAGELSEEDLEAAKQRWVEFIHAVDAQDAEAACGYMLHPETGETGEGDPECEEGLEETVLPQVESGEYAELDASLVEAEDNGDGTVTVTLDGEPFPLPMGQGEDGDWYITDQAG